MVVGLVGRVVLRFVHAPNRAQIAPVIQEKLHILGQVLDDVRDLAMEGGETAKAATDPVVRVVVGGGGLLV